MSLALMLFMLPALAQESGNESNSAITGFVANQLSTPNRQIRFSGIRGALTSEAAIDEITIADRDGVWLRVQNAEIVWTRLALLRGRLEINRLTADRIEVIRRPLPDRGLPAPESRRFELPDLPVSVNIEEFQIASANFGAGVFGLESEVNAIGSVSLRDGSLDASLDIERLDGPGGQLHLDASFANDTEQLDIDLELREPENGILANLAKIEGRPPVSVTIKGSGPLGNVDLALTFDANDQRILTGTAQLRRADAGLRFGVDLSGPIAEIVPPAYRPFFGQDTALVADGVMRETGEIAVDRFELDAAQMSIAASGEMADGFLQKLSLRGQITSDGGDPVVLPVSGSATTLRNGTLTVSFGIDASESWSAQVDANGFATEGLQIERMQFSGGGLAEALNDASRRHIAFSGSGAATGLEAENPDIAQALGDEMKLEIAGDWRAGEPIMLERATLAAREMLVALSGSIADFTLTGDLSLETSDLAPLSGLAGQSIEGSASISASGNVKPLRGEFELTLDGAVGDLRLENRSLDGLLRGTTTIDGGFARNEEGFDTRDFRVANPQFELTADGAFATGEADFDFTTVVNDLASISDKVSGELTATGFARGGDGQISLSADVAIPGGTLLDKPFAQANLAFSGSKTRGDIAGRISGGADLDGAPVSLRSEITVREDGTRTLEGLRLTAQGADITGTLTQTGTGYFDGALDIDAPDISTLASLFLQQASGAVEAHLALSAAVDRQDANFAATLNGVSIQSVSIQSGRADFELTDIFGSPKANGDLSAAGVIAGGLALTKLDVTANREGDETTLAADAVFATGAAAQLQGLLMPFHDGFALELEQLTLTHGSLSASLAKPSSITMADQTVSIDTTQFQVGDGMLTLSGSYGEDLALDVRINAVPIDIINTVQPDLGLTGTINGSATIDGPRDRPRALFDVRAQDVSAAPLREAGLQAVTITASGQSTRDGLSVTAEASSPQGLRIRAEGTVPLADGAFDLRIQGEAPLALADQFIEDRGANSEGTVEFRLTIRGPRNDPVFDGDFSIRDAQFIDPETNLRLRNIRMDGTISPGELRIVKAEASPADGGAIAATGRIGLGNNFPAELEIRLDNARYREEDLLSATLDGTLRVTGPLTRDPTIEGSITVERAEIVVPEKFGGGTADIDVRHRSTPPAVEKTLESARGPNAVPTPTARPSVVKLDISIVADRRIFVRGRGLDAEVGGRFRITGAVSDIRPVGGFELIRGRLSILGQRITFDEGSVQLVGSLDPVLYFVARTARAGISVIVTVTGRASDPKIELSSQPPLPEDEILAQLIFSRSLGELSALQIARLAAAAAELAGSGSSLTGKLRKATGLDDIDIYTNAEGNTAVRAGRYVRENIYLGVEAGAGGETEGTINLDISDTVRAKGSLSSDGSSSIGLFYEKDY